MRHLLLFLILIPLATNGQLSDDFSDGDFSNNPTWSGDAANFEVDGNFKLHLNAPATADEAYLSTPSVAVDTSVWEVLVEMDFNPSASNRSRIYLMSSASNLEGNLEGYFVQLGNSEDEVSLYRQTGSTTTKIIDGIDDLLDLSSVSVLVRVTRSTEGLWELYADTSLTGNYVLMGDTNDTTYTTTSFFGIWCDYTATRSDKFFFDDIMVSGNAYLDVDAPEIESALATSSDSVLLVFDESIDASTGTNTLHYTINQGVGNPNSVAISGDSAVWLVYSVNTFISGSSYELTVENVEDLSGNAITNAMASFTYFEFGTPSFRDIVINEIMADPTPAVGLPEEEFVEIYNPTGLAFNLSQAEFADAKDTSDFPSNAILAPGEYAILCNDDDTALFSGFGKLIPMSTLPALNNTGDDLKLIVNGILVDRVAYTDQWYADNDRKGNGHTLELKNPNTPCGGQSNWSASKAETGGTPGNQNSNLDLSPDTVAPSISEVLVVDQLNLLISFNERMDSASLAGATFEFLAGPIIDFQVVAPDFFSINLRLVGPLDSTVLYQFVYSSGITDCAGNPLAMDTVSVGIGVDPKPFDLVINEIYADPSDNAALPDAEFVEIYNRSDKLINLDGLSLADRSSQSSVHSGFMASGEYVIIADDAFINAFEPFGKVATVSSMPSLNNSDDDLQLLLDTIAIDQVFYDQDWYGGSRTDGVTLERVNYENLCGASSNWSASTAAIGGTPGAENSVLEIAPFEGPKIAGAFFSSFNQIEIEFDQVLEPSATYAAEISVNNNKLNIDTVNSILLGLSSSETFNRGMLYSISIDSVSNCAGLSTVSLEYSLYLHDESDVIINEVLFNPRESGTDFVELYNYSEYEINLQNWSLAYFDSNDSLRYNQISEQPILLAPDHYLALNENAENLEKNYPNSVGGQLPEMNLPSYPNDEGAVILFDQLGGLMERFNYSDDMHFPLIDNPDGVSLERLSPSRPASDTKNWHSASSSENFATPGYINSQDYSGVDGSATFSLSAEHISPDNDGYQDVVNIEYSLNEPGHVASVNVYNDRGTLVRSLYTNNVLGNKGSLTWDGTNDRGEKARTGIHVILIETFDLGGNRARYKLPIVVATRL